MLSFGIALAVAVVPEALPAVVTISLALGAQRMVRRNALVRRLSAVETLGSVSVIASDKTGTLTTGEMTVRQVIAGDKSLTLTDGGFIENGRPVPSPPAALALLQGAALASDARSDAAGQLAKGDPTERALVVAAAKAGLCKHELDTRNPRLAEIPFSSETKRMTTLHRTVDGVVAYSKGAPEVIVAGCNRVLGADGERLLSPGERERVLEAARALAGCALRVLAVAVKWRAELKDAERGMTLLGLVGMSDPPRPQAGPAIATCERAGIKPILITGDHVLTAAAVARELGILKDGRLVTGAELDAMSDDELEDQVAEIDVYARVSPAHKLRVVTAWQKKGRYVAMTGDGVNDAPALKTADIGVAMGITGTDVTKDAAAMTLIDDNFASIVSAVEEGRGVFSNVKKYLMYLLSSNIGEIGLMAGASLIGLPLPLTAVQLLYVNLATDGLPALALAVDPPETDLMARPPRDPRTGIFTRPVLVLTILGGVWSTLLNVGLFAWALGSGRSVTEAVTMTFVSLVLIQFFKAYNFRSDRHSVFVRPFANRWLNLAIAWEIALLSLIVYLPLLHQPFSTFPLTAGDWLIIVGAALTISPVLEAAKWMERRGWFGEMRMA
jgi:Ca2+-transporting ATPase